MAVHIVQDSRAFTQKPRPANCSVAFVFGGFRRSTTTYRVGHAPVPIAAPGFDGDGRVQQTSGDMMASGRQHRAAYRRNIETLTPAGYVLALVGFIALFGDSWRWVLLGAVLILLAVGWIYGLRLGMVANPDMDMENARRGDTYTSHWPWFVRKLWAHYWRDYADAIPHRHRDSHQPGHGTAIRLFYMVPLPVVFITVPLWPFWVGLFVGMCVQDVCHARMDGWRLK